MGQNNDRLLHITIGAHPAKELNLAQEIKLIKAALLYADHVKLYSLTASALSMASRFSSLPLDYKINVLENVIPIISPQNQSKGLGEILRKYKKIVDQKNSTSEDLSFKEQTMHLLNNSWAAMEEATNKIIQDSKLLELKNALDSGALELHTFENANTDQAVANFMIESITTAVNNSSSADKKKNAQDNKIIMEFADQVFRSVSNNSTHPLFDEGTASLVQARAGMTNFSLPKFGVDRGKQAGLIKNLFEYLPTFEDATVDEILDIRKELDKSLTRFRSAVINFSEDIESAVWDKDFQPEVDKIYHRDIEPAMLEIDEQVKSNKFLTTLIKKVAEKPAVLPTGSLLSMAISQFSSLPKELAASLGVGVASASLIYEAYEEWKKKKQDTEKNLLYFYYGVNKRLKK